MNNIKFYTFATLIGVLVSSCTLFQKEESNEMENIFKDSLKAKKGIEMEIRPIEEQK